MAAIAGLGGETHFARGDDVWVGNNVGPVPIGKGSLKHLLLIGHMDTVFEEDSPFQRWEVVDDSIARGPGAAGDRPPGISLPASPRMQ